MRGGPPAQSLRDSSPAGGAMGAGAGGPPHSGGRWDQGCAGGGAETGRLRCAGTSPSVAARQLPRGGSNGSGSGRPAPSFLPPPVIPAQAGIHATSQHPLTPRRSRRSTDVSNARAGRSSAVGRSKPLRCHQIAWIPACAGMTEGWGGRGGGGAERGRLRCAGASPSVAARQLPRGGSNGSGSGSAPQSGGEGIRVARGKAGGGGEAGV